MKLTKEDYMCLPKERLAELLVEKDLEEAIKTIPNTSPYVPAYPPTTPYVPCTTWWQDIKYEITCSN